MTDMSLCIYMVREEKGYRPFKRASFFLHCWPKMLISQAYEKQKKCCFFFRTKNVCTKPREKGLGMFSTMIGHCLSNRIPFLPQSVIFDMTPTWKLLPNPFFVYTVNNQG